MKKNVMMRVASVLLVAVMLTTCAISGTFAKYTTNDSASDTARVAKWGVNVIATGNLFGQNYNGNTTNVEAGEKVDEISVSAKQSVDANENIVAPGTKNTEGMTFAVKGTPEVANRITVSSDTYVEEEIWLLAGTYGVMVEAKGVTTDNVTAYYVLSNGAYVKATQYALNTKYYELHDLVTVAANHNGKYYPITWTITNVVNTGLGVTDTTVASDEYTLTDVVSAISTAFTTTGTQNNANLAIDETVTLTWQWLFNGNDGADTILGNLQGWTESDNYVVVKKPDANSDSFEKVVNDADYNLEIKFDITITIDQVD